VTLKVFGIGSPAGDDQAGWLVVDALQALLMGSDVVLEKLDRPGVSLVGLIDGVSHAIVVDAMQSGIAAGEVRHFSGLDWNGYGGGLSSHGLGVLDALALAQAMGALPRKLDVYGIEIESADPLEGPGSAVRDGASKLAADIAARLKRSN
jgi:hydrogenase maturation protease